MTVSPGRSDDTLPATWLAARMAVIRRASTRCGAPGELIAVREPGSTEWRYPAWQFESGTSREPRSARIVAAARESGVDEARLYES